MRVYVTKNDEGKYWDYNTLKWSENPNGHYTGNETSAKCTAFNRLGHVVELVEKPEPVETSEDTVAKILREAKRYADDYISEDKLKFEIKTALSVYKPAPEVVSEAEAEMLERAKASGYPVSAISGWCYEGEEDLTDVEDRLMRAYVNGWTVEKPKRYVVYQILPGSHIGDDAIQAIKHTDNTSAVAWMFAESANLGKFSDRLFTDAEIKHYGLQDCEKVEVTE